MQFLGTKLQAGEAGNWQALLLDLQQLMEERLEAGVRVFVCHMKTS
jgi:predicted peroxiredoxin